MIAVTILRNALAREGERDTGDAADPDRAPPPATDGAAIATMPAPSRRLAPTGASASSTRP